MTLLLFCKQIVDMFYDYRLPDYLLAGFAVVLVIYRLWLVRPEKISVKITDICIIIFSVLVVMAYIRGSISDFVMFGKIMSALLMYFMGRICYERIYEGTWALSLAAYIVIYVNLGVYVVNGFSGSGMYYYDTDLAYAVLLGLIFVAMYSKNTIVKFVTMFITCPYLIMHADAGVQQVLLVVVYAILFIYMGERAVKKRKASDLILPIAISGLLCAEAALIAPVFMEKEDNAFVRFLNENIMATGNLTGRYNQWREMWSSMKESDIAGILLGTGKGYDLGNQYMSILNMAGILGIIVMVVFVVGITMLTVRVNDRKTYYTTVLLAILFLGTCINVNGVEFTQMSWLPMMYAGLVATAGCEKQESEI